MNTDITIDELKRIVIEQHFQIVRVIVPNKEFEIAYKENYTSLK